MPPAKSNQTKLKNRLIEVTNLSSRDANAYLERANWDVEEALNLYFNNSESSANPKTIKQIEKVFETYQEDDDTIGIDGTLKYIEDLGYQPEDLTILALAEFLNSPSTGIFKRSDFVNSWAKEGISSIDSMKLKLKEFEKLLETDTAFRQKIYNFTFKYVLEEGQRSLNPDTAVDYWQLLLSNFEQDKVTKWCNFITQKHNYAVSKDQWQMTFEFFLWWTSHDLKEYDEALAWPSLMDSFVENELEG